MSEKKEYIDREKLIAEYDRVHIGVAGGARKLMVDAPTEDVQEVNKIVEFINIAINGTPSKTDYDIGLKNGLKLALSVIDGKEPDFEKCNNNEILLPLTHQELKHLINDLISYIWKLEDKGLDKAEFGYFSRKELLEKLKQFEKENFQPLAESPSRDAKMDGGK